MKFWAIFLATFGGVGYCPVAPGTAATAAGIVVALICQGSLFLYSAVTVVLFVVGVSACTYMEKLLGVKDPGVACIDEVVGVLIALWSLPLTWPVVISGFFLFRALDMFKIYPINRLEAIEGGMGIMLDDVMAGLYTNIILRLALGYAGLI